jgi:haloacetate dehalogenase
MAGFFHGFSRYRIPTEEAEINLVLGGNGPPLLLLHGYPQTHVMWHKVAPALAQEFTVVVPDLRGYGDSSKPKSDLAHYVYSKRATGNDMVAVMERLGFSSFLLAGHDRGARVAHRLTLDHPARVERLAVLDIIPTRTVFERVDKALATSTYHWFFLIQPELPEALIGANPDFYLEWTLKKWSSVPGAFTPEALAEYRRCFRDPAAIHATCEDYRAGASIDLEHDEADITKKIECPLLTIWGDGPITKCAPNVETWRERATNVTGFPIDCGHFLAEEKPEETTEALAAFFSGKDGVSR